jgi:hypothetical protein
LERETATPTSLRGCSLHRLENRLKLLPHNGKLNHDNFIQTSHLWRNPATSCRDTSTTGGRPRQSFTKWVDCQTVRLIPSYVKELAEWEEGGTDGQSYEIEFSDKRYLVGRLAQLMGGLPAFEGGQS